MWFSNGDIHLSGLDKAYNTDIASSQETYIDQKVKHNGREGMYPSSVFENKKQGYGCHLKDTVV